MLRFALLFAFVCSATFIPLRAHALTSKSAYPIGRHCAYQFIADRNISPQDLVGRYSSTWLRSSHDIVALGAMDQTLWFKCQFQNDTPLEAWFLVSRYPFSSRMSIFQWSSNRIWTETKGGTQVAPVDKSLPYHNDAFRVLLQPGKVTEFLVKYESDFTKILFFEIMPEEFLQRSEKQELVAFVIITTITGLIVMVNVLLAWRWKTILPMSYVAALVAAYVYQSFEFGFGTWYMFSGMTHHSPYLLMGFGAATMTLYPLFLRNLLSLKVILPVANRFVIGLIFASALLCVCAFAGFFPVIILQQLGRWIYAVVTISVFYVIIRVYRMGFRPALYSGYGLITLFATQNFYILSMSGVFQVDGYWIKFLVPLGQLAEFLLFFRSLFMRLSDQKDNLMQLESIEAEQERIAAEKKNAKFTRLDSQTADALAERLEQLFKIDKLFEDDELSLEKLSARLSVKRHQLSELLNTRFSSSFYDYVNRHRVREAERLILADPQKRILDISLAVGFNTKSTFNKEFKRLTGRTPSDARAAAQSQ